MSRVDDLDYVPVEIAPPGETLTEWLEREDMTQVEFARRTSLTPKHINQVVKGGAGISPEVAIAFENVTAIPARYWTQLEANYQTAKQRAEEAEMLTEHVGLVDLFPVNELTKRGALPRSSTRLGKLRSLLRFFNVADPRALEEVWLRTAHYRRSKAFEAHEGALAAWLRLAELEAAEVQTTPFDAAACREAIPRMRALSTWEGVEWLKPLKELCASLGIVLVVLKELPGCRINGATRWLSPEKSMIVLSLRHRRNDIFWFTFFHELCHLLRHSKKETFVDKKNGNIAQDLEDEADAFAARTLIPPPRDRDLSSLTTRVAVIEFADDIGVAPGIVVGRMQHEGLIAHSRWADLIDRYRFADD